ncbi:UDP-2,4-diacetamido-2,4,6-trideoxy-beta-L-altropyranose hydrolase [Dechloromonas sp. XY25]|uniref:UDP-2,4-diacetamido-2,4, 6-trideoxy-beta-L-altropyranose hydrolase n=1 Tax=Dechloromonas hankyongensis TaxID=2908002 RepID=A0ABS9K6T6_9RHOO|nr:UDP-2,4-diacetamido-2,4,6-trideoxy-beta-L-altropyranose hydrolase [Dechloromonas hankyongensis]MCG2578878.1 UDP-2,4-diacetamido-2,4,6-trideoxy-beta-L-altropyranose hydrolase [Dechloromonas hankyongensis]
MFIAFRVDANAIIGTGHVMRCLALAQALAARGSKCLFICRADGLGALAERIRQDGHQLATLPEGTTSPGGGLAHARFLPHGQTADAQACLDVLAQHPGPDWLVVDHYALDARWESAIRPATAKILVIDDLADRDHDCDALLDQNLRPATEANPYLNRTPAHCRHLLGPSHALLRPEFSVARQSRSNQTSTTPRLLVMFGGADREDLTGRAVRLLPPLLAAMAIDVVVGPLYAHREALAQGLAALPDAALHIAPANVAAVMAKADLALASPGTTSWERCALGLPSITLAVADNQVAMAEELARRGAHLYLGRSDAVSDSDLATALHLLAGNPHWRQAMADAASAITDGSGAARVSQFMNSSRLDVRTATPDDARMLHLWRNDPGVRQHTFDPSPIPWESHKAWFEAALSDSQRVVLIGQMGGTDVGCVRFDIRPAPNDHQARISIYLDPAHLGEGLAAPLLIAADAWLRDARPAISSTIAEVMADNEASRRAFLRAGYRHDHSVFIKQG